MDAPDTDAVELMGLGEDCRALEPADFHTCRNVHCRAAWRRSLSAEETHQVLRLWRNVPTASDQARCHIPAFGLRLFREGVEIQRVAPCFDCGNASIWTPTGEDWQIIDGESEAARQMLAMLFALAPAPWRAWTQGLGDRELLSPWVVVREEEQALSMELNREADAGHPLHDVRARALARRGDKDDVLFQLEDGRLAVVHLTWSRRPEPAPSWPATTIFATVDEWVGLCSMRPDHDEAG